MLRARIGTDACAGRDSPQRCCAHQLISELDVIATWQARAAMKVNGKALPGRHFLPEEAPEQTLAELQVFLSA